MDALTRSRLGRTEQTLKNIGKHRMLNAEDISSKCHTWILLWITVLHWCPCTYTAPTNVTYPPLWLASDSLPVHHIVLPLAYTQANVYRLTQFGMFRISNIEIWTFWEYNTYLVLGGAVPFELAYHWSVILIWVNEWSDLWCPLILYCILTDTAKCCLIVSRRGCLLSCYPVLLRIFVQFNHV